MPRPRTVNKKISDLSRGMRKVREKWTPSTAPSKRRTSTLLTIEVKFEPWALGLLQSIRSRL